MTDSIQTQLIQTTTQIDPTTGAIVAPVHHTSTYHQTSVSEFGKFDYSRSGNPTRELLETAIAELEHGTRGFAFSSGMAAISAALLTLSHGDHLVIAQDVYGGTFRFVTQHLPRYGITATFVDPQDLDAVVAAFTPHTKVLYLETPSNPTLSVTDISAAAELAHQHKVKVFVDNTFMTPYLQQPLLLGADLVVHSATKFLGGHSDLLAGLVVTNEAKLGEQVYNVQNSFGAVLSPADSWLLLRGIKTLGARLDVETASAEKIAKYLISHKKVTHVYYPGLATHPLSHIHLTQSKNGGAIVSFDIGGEEQVKILHRHLRLPVFSVSLGGVESILSYPRTMSHAAMSTTDREERGITDGLLRLSVGLENVDDLIADLDNALSYL